MVRYLTAGEPTTNHSPIPIPMVGPFHTLGMYLGIIHQPPPLLPPNFLTVAYIGFISQGVCHNTIFFFSRGIYCTRCPLKNGYHKPCLNMRRGFVTKQLRPTGLRRAHRYFHFCRCGQEVGMQ
ncbi:hypothetical protein K445DRAFT_291745 [Daldinia sp. EC12]|nr:hypothetical protein K445DRAFT_291745 [Daldinia sp. EC12]